MALNPGYGRCNGTSQPSLAITTAALIYSRRFMTCLLKITAVRKRAAACTTRAKFLSRAVLLGVALTGLVSYSRAAIKNPGGYR